MRFRRDFPRAGAAAFSPGAAGIVRWAAITAAAVMLLLPAGIFTAAPPVSAGTVSSGSPRVPDAGGAAAVAAAGTIGGTAGAAPSPRAASPAPHVIPVYGPIEPGLVKFVERAMEDARKAGAPLIIFEVNTPGGRADAAFDLRDLVLGSPVPTAAHVSRRALSAGALIALAGDELYMAPGSTIGAAEPAPRDEKTVSAIRAEFESTAEARGRNPLVAAAMVDSDVIIPGVVEEGKILTLTARRAVDEGFADGMAATRGELLEALGFTGTGETVAGMRAAEWVARWVTHPTVSALLLALGFLGILIEVFTPGFGLPGTLGLTFIVLYFGGHVLAGLAGFEAALLVVASLALLAIEAVIPGFGFFGIAGLAAMVAAVFLVSPTPGQAARNLAFAVIISFGGAFALFRLTGGRVLPRLTLTEALAVDGGFTARSRPAELHGRSGTALTDLRPAGVALIDGRRHDVVTEGVFIPKNTPVQVIEAAGNRIVVRRVPEDGLQARRAEEKMN